MRRLPRKSHHTTSSTAQPLDAQATELENRYQNLVHQFRKVQLQVYAVHTQYRAARQEHEWLRQVVNTKQQVIEHLLPYYPHPLTCDLIAAIELY
jgi:hypothetical protein